MLHNRNIVNLLILMMLLISALSVVSAQHEGRKLNMEIQLEKKRAEQMQVDKGRLELELGTWAAPSRIEQVAGSELKMRQPEDDETYYIDLTGQR